MCTNEDRINYLDHAATTPVREDVLEKMLPYFTQKFGNPSSLYALAGEARYGIDEAREQVAEVLGGRAAEIVFTGGGSESDNTAIKGVAAARALSSARSPSNGHIITTAIEHHAVIHPVEQLEKMGYASTVIGVDSTGRVNPGGYAAAVRPNTFLASVMLVNNEVGTIQPVKEITELAHEKNILVHTDAVQCLGKMPIAVNDLGVDFLSLSAHKFYGPKGIGILYFKNRESLSSLMMGGGQERGLRAGTENIASIAGMGLAAELAATWLDHHIEELESFEAQFRSGLLSYFPNAIFYGDADNKLPGLVNVSFSSHRSDILLAKLDRANMAVSSGSACGAGDVKPSGVLSEMGVDDKTNISTLRFSFGASNTTGQLDLLLSELKTILTD